MYGGITESQRKGVSQRDSNCLAVPFERKMKYIGPVISLDKPILAKYYNICMSVLNEL